MEDEDEHALQGVEDGKEIGQDDGLAIDEQQPEGPRKTQET